nr:hypothetical protein [Tanacetum cinerariifolium]
MDWNALQDLFCSSSLLKIDFCGLELVDQDWVKHAHDHFRAPTALDMEVLIKTCLMPLSIKTQNDSFTFVHELKHGYAVSSLMDTAYDGEHLDKMKEKRDPYSLVGYSTQFKGYRVYNKRTRLIVESILLRFDEIKEMSETSVANETLGLVPQRQKASYYDNSGPIP